MKKITFLLVAMLAFCWQGHAQVLTEGFESGAIPAGWTLEYGSGTLDWTYVAQNGNASITPRTGAYMAEFRNDTSGSATKLVTPALDLITLSNPQLTFYYANVNWFGDIDELRVYYKSSAGGAWTQIGIDYTAEQTAWTEVKLILPNPSNDYYIAFEGTSNWARGLNLDDVLVGEGPNCTPTVVDSSTVVDDCGNSQFSVDVVVSTVGDGTNITDGLGGSFPVVAGTVTAGPYASGTNVTLTMEHSDPACNFSLGNFQYFCPPSNIDCANATPMVCGDTISATSVGSTGNQEGSGCSIGDNGIWFTFTGTGGDMTVESTASFDHEMAITSGACGSLVNIVCDDGSIGTETHTFTSSPGETYYVYIAHYASGSTTTGTIDVTLTCAAIPTCFEVTNLDVTVLPGDTSATVSWDVEGSATLGYNWVVMNEFDDPELDAPVASGSTAVGVTTDTATGLTAGNDYDFYVQSNCDTNGLSAWAGPYNFTSTAPPANDECADAIALTVNPDYDCGTVT